MKSRVFLSFLFYINLKVIVFSSIVISFNFFFFFVDVFISFFNFSKYNEGKGVSRGLANGVEHGDAGKNKLRYLLN